MSGFVGIGVGTVFVKKIVIFEIQISRNWLHRRNDPILGPSKFRSSGHISLALSSSDPRCWGSMHIYVGYFHPKNNFDISHRKWNYEISSWTVYFYRARYCFLGIDGICALFLEIHTAKVFLCFEKHEN